MDRNELQKLRDLPIEGVAERLGLQVVQHKALCPFHDDHHASLSFSLRRNTFRCFVCGASGGTIDLVMKYLNKGFLEACRWLGAEAPPSAPEGATNARRQNSNEAPSGAVWGAFYARFFEHPWLSAEARHFLFDERRIDPRVVRWCRLTSWRDKQGVPWLQTPYYDREGRLIGIQNRNLVKGALPRFRFPTGSECSIYNLPVLNMLKPGETLFITEGCSDCWAMLSAGHKAIAIPSATLLSRKDVELLRSLDSSAQGEGSEGWEGKDSSPHRGRSGGGFTFAMYPDNDLPGERLFFQLKEVLPSLVHHQLPPGCKDFSEYYLSSLSHEQAT